MTMLAALLFLPLTVVLDSSDDEADRSVASKGEFAQDTVLSAGEFNRIDRSHWARGSAEIVRTQNGHIVRLGTGFEANPGPDLRIVLSTAANPQNADQLGDYVELGLLESTSGAQSYSVPDDVDLSTVGSVVVYCKRFSVIFSVAELTTDGR